MRDRRERVESEERGRGLSRERGKRGEDMERTEIRER